MDKSILWSRVQTDVACMAIYYIAPLLCCCLQVDKWKNAHSIRLHLPACLSLWWPPWAASLLCWGLWAPGTPGKPASAPTWQGPQGGLIRLELVTCTSPQSRSVVQQIGITRWQYPYCSSSSYDSIGRQHKVSKYMLHWDWSHMFTTFIHCVCSAPWMR